MVVTHILYRIQITLADREFADIGADQLNIGNAVALDDATQALFQGRVAIQGQSLKLRLLFYGNSPKNLFLILSNGAFLNFSHLLESFIMMLNALNTLTGKSSRRLYSLI